MITNFSLSHEAGFFTIHWNGFDSQAMTAAQILPILTHWAAQLPAKREEFPTNVAWRAFQIKVLSSKKLPKK